MTSSGTVGGKLTGPEIRRLVAAGELVIEPFDPNKVNPASYNVSLGPDLLVYEKMWPLHRYHEMRHEEYARVSDFTHTGPIDTREMRDTPRPYSVTLDMAVDEPVRELKIPPEGLVLWPGVLYLGSTTEYTETSKDFVPELTGRSSTARLGLLIHFTAGLGDPCFRGEFTCELAVMFPLRIYSGVPVAQLSYSTTVGEPKPYTGQYNGQRGPKKSGLWKWFAKK